LSLKIVSVEIERKFLVHGEDWRTQASGILYAQGYLAADPERTVRVRIAGHQGYLTIKGASIGCSRPEFEYPIPIADAQELLSLCQLPPIQKFRFTLTFADMIWEVDEFLGSNQGLILAEVELTDANQTIQLPSWVGAEVTGDLRYYNSNLARCPYQEWAPPRKD
jgi:CYTH domain-containing protein